MYITATIATHLASLRFLHFSLLNSVLRPKLSCRSICLCMISSADNPCALNSAISSEDNNSAWASTESVINSLVSWMSSVFISALRDRSPILLAATYRSLPPLSASSSVVSGHCSKLDSFSGLSILLRHLCPCLFAFWPFYPSAAQKSSSRLLQHLPLPPRCPPRRDAVRRLLNQESLALEFVSRM